MRSLSYSLINLKEAENLPDIAKSRDSSMGKKQNSFLFRTTLYNVCSVHRGMFSTSGGVQYIGGCSVHRGDTMSTSGGYHEYIGGIP